MRIVLFYQLEESLVGRIRDYCMKNNCGFHSLKFGNDDQIKSFKFDSDDVLLIRFNEFGIKMVNQINDLVINARAHSSTVINLNAFTKFPESSDKWHQYMLFRNNHIPCSITRLSHELDDWNYFETRLFAKKRLGSRGEGSKIITDNVGLRMFEQNNNAEDYIFQQLEDVIRDVRVIVVGSRVIGSVVRDVIRHEDGHIGVKVRESVDIDEKDKLLAVDVATKMNLDYCGVDLLSRRNGDVFVCEVNIAPRFDSFERVTHIDVVEKILRNFLRV